MSLESILERIRAEGQAEKAKIIQAAQKEARELISRAQREAECLDQEIVKREKTLAEKQKQGVIVNARLQAKNALLASKQEIINAVFQKVTEGPGKGKFKKQVITHEKSSEVPEEAGRYLENIRYEHETEIARVLFE